MQPKMSVVWSYFIVFEQASFVSAVRTDSPDFYAMDLLRRFALRIDIDVAVLIFQRLVLFFERVLQQRKFLREGTMLTPMQFRRNQTAHDAVFGCDGFEFFLP